MSARAPQRTCVLVVEDEDLVRQIAVEAITDEGYEVLEAANGREALDIVDRGALVDVLFTDVNMPGQPDGVALAEEVCARRPSTRIIVSSARPLPIRVLPCDGRFLAKPYRLAELGELIRAVTA